MAPLLLLAGDWPGHILLLQPPPVGVCQTAVESFMSDIEAFIRRLPKAELHLHLEGTILPSTLLELSARHPPRLPAVVRRTHPLTLPEAEALYRFTNFTGFLDAFKSLTNFAWN